MSVNRRKSIRRQIGYGARIAAADGSWQRACRVLDVSATGARLALEEPAELPADFILALSAHGAATRRCRVVWKQGGEVGVRFERHKAA